MHLQAAAAHQLLRLACLSALPLMILQNVKAEFQCGSRRKDSYRALQMVCFYVFRTLCALLSAGLSISGTLDQMNAVPFLHSCAGIGIMCSTDMEHIPLHISTSSWHVHGAVFVCQAVTSSFWAPTNIKQTLLVTHDTALVDQPLPSSRHADHALQLLLERGYVDLEVKQATTISGEAI